MKKGKSSISKSSSYEQMGCFWDSHDLTAVDSKTKKAEFDVDIENEKIYCVLDRKISNELQLLASKKGVSPDTLVNLLLKEKLRSVKNK